MKKYLVQFDFGLYNAFGESLEVLTEEEFQKIKDFSESGEKVYLGEIEGKHSEVFGTLDAKDFKVISENQDDIAVFEKVLGWGFGAYSMLENVEEKLSENA